MEAAAGVEPAMEILQTSALPLGYAASAQTPLKPRKADDRAHRLCPLPRPDEGELERVKGLEPSTFCMASRRSSQLSYTRGKRG